MAERKGGRARSETARTSILAATRLLLAAQGFDGLTIEGVAAEAGVGKQTIYRWWPSKTALVADCIAEGAPAMSLEAPVPDSGDLQADIESWLTLLGEYSAEPQAAALMRGLISAAAESSVVAERLYSQVTRGAEEALRRRLAAGHHDSVAVDRAAAASSALLGAFVYGLLVNRPMEALTVRELSGLIARGIRDFS